MKSFFGICFLCFFTGCSTIRPVISPSSLTIAPEIIKATTTGEKASETIHSSVKEVKSLTLSGRNEAPALAQWSALDTEASIIETANAVISAQFGVIRQMSDKIEDLEKGVNDQSAHILHLNDTIKQLENKNNQWVFRVSLAVAATGMALGVGLFFVPGMHKIGVTVLLASMACAGVAKFFLQFPWVLPSIGGLIVLTMAYVIWRNRKNMLDLVDFSETVAKEQPASSEELAVKVSTIKDKSTQKAIRDTKKLLVGTEKAATATLAVEAEVL